MKATIPVQKSIFFKAIKRLIFVCLVMAGLFSCEAAGHDALPDERTIQEVKRRAMAGKSEPLKNAVDSIVVFKSRREMHVYGLKRKLKTYVISLGTQPVGQKHMEGDYKTPEGRYIINDKNPNSIYHKNLAVSYPNAIDTRYAREHNLHAGGDIKIHGLPNQLKYEPEAYLRSDWTWGCIAVSNEEIDELYRYVAVGASITIFP